MNPQEATTLEGQMPAEPEEAEEACSADPGEIAEARASQREQEAGPTDSQTVEPMDREQGGAASEEQPEERHWVSVELVYEDGTPVPNEPFIVRLSDGSRLSGRTGEDGTHRIEGIRQAGSCEVCFPRIAEGEWRRL